MRKPIYCQPILNILLLWMLMCVAQLAHAQGTNSHVLHLRTGDVYTTPNVTRWADSTARQGNTGPVLALLHFATLPTAAQKAQLLQQGIWLQDYMPDNSYYAIMRTRPDAAQLNALPLYSITDVPVAVKADNYLWNKAKTEPNSIEVLVTFFGGVSRSEIQEFLIKTGAQKLGGGMEALGAYKVRIPAAQLHSIASWYGVHYISPAPEMVPLDLQSKPAVKGSKAYATPANGGYGLGGDSVVVGVGDNASGVYHYDLKDRIQNFCPGPMRNHGAHINGIVGGAALIEPFAQGMAPRASLLNFFFDQVLASTPAMVNDHGMSITNNSYAVMLGDCSYSGTYDGYSRYLDTLALLYPDVLHIFASGNDGYLSCSPFPAGYATVSGGYQPAKNNVVVGSTTDYYLQAIDESRGPVKDGRLKPEIVAPGVYIYSTIEEDNYLWSGGTSMASPHVAGGVALLTQRYKQRNGGTQPKADVMKAVLLNGAMDLGNAGPDFAHGFGSMDVGRSLSIIDNNRIFAGTVFTSNTATHTITVPANTARLKVLVTWADQPGNPTASKQLVNDLDLAVTTPTTAVRLPLVPDATPANVTNTATERADHLNNTEQVTIDNPAAGSYNIRVNGYSVPSGNQRYVVSYDFVPTGIDLTYPIAGSQWNNNDTFRIFWNAIADGRTFKIEFSQDNGANWTTIAEAVGANEHYFPWRPGTYYNSGNCLVRVSRNGTSVVATSGRFVINNETSITLDTSQCPGYINVHWAAVPGASYYQMLVSKGGQMVVTDTATDTAYTYINMPTDRPSIVATRPIMSGMEGYRSRGKVTTANWGSCTKAVSGGNLTIEQALAPATGRLNTSTQLSSSETLSLKVRNLYALPCNAYTITYRINGGTLQVYSSGPAIPANSAITVNIPGLNLADTGTYRIWASITNQSLADPVPANDSITFTVRQLPNDTVLLPYADGFEAMGKMTVTKDSAGVSPESRWDFSLMNDMGRMRSYVTRDVVITGERSVSMDVKYATGTGSGNSFTGTFNLSNYDTADAEIRLDFDYVLHGEPASSAGNEVWCRANDGSPWVQIFAYDLNAIPGVVKKAKSISLTDAVRNGLKNFSTSTQIAFLQNDTSLIAGRDYGNGLTLDNINLYTVVNDAEIVKVITPLPTNCGLTSPQPLVVQVHNGVNYTLRNVQLYYRLDSGTIYTGTLDSITAKNTVNYTFAQQMNIIMDSLHKLDVWLSVAGDSYTGNDSLLQYKFRNNRIINTFPYLENFENGKGGYYGDGISSSWGYGKPAAAHINKAASGTKAWKTNLNGRYNNLETSYLYTPCFDITGLTKPMLSFSAALDIEDCGSTMCDQAYVEYTFNGINWFKLGNYLQGTNWYDSSFDVWKTQGDYRWHVASIPLPQPPSGETIHFRFVLQSDPGAGFEGLAVDDVHIYDLTKTILPALNVPPLTSDLSGSGYTDFKLVNKIAASINPLGQNMPQTTVQLYEQTTTANTGKTQFIIPRSYLVQSGGTTADSIGIILYLKDAEVKKIMADTTCPSCTPVTDAYALGITQYINTNDTTLENDLLADDTGGMFRYYPARQIKWVPYDDGYYAQTKIKNLSELWLNNGGPAGNYPLGPDYLSFAAYKSGNDVQLNWKSFIDTSVERYMVQRSADGITYNTLLDTAAANLNPGMYAITDNNPFTVNDTLYYRIAYTLSSSDAVHYTPVRKLTNDATAQGINFAATMVNATTVRNVWTSYVDGIVTNYILERAINNRGYEVIKTSKAVQLYGHTYTYNDLPDASVPDGAVLYYKLTAITETGDTIILPVQTIDWNSANTIIAVYPNPVAGDVLYINWYATAGTIMDLRLTDITGRQVFAGSVQAGQWNNTTTVTLPMLSKGMYVLQTISGGKSTATKVVKY